jgi:hypothetical protein
MLRSIVLAASLAATACSPPVDGRRAVPSYDAFSRRLVQLSADQDGDGRADQWTYLDGNRPLRGEADTDADGRVDRWEYFDANAQLQRVGTSSRNDGVEDTWAYVRRLTVRAASIARVTATGISIAANFSGAMS